MLSYAAVRGREQRGDRRPLPPQALPIILHPASCGVAPGLSRLATPTRPSTGPSVLASICLTGHVPAVCMCQGVSFGGTSPHHREPPSGNHTAQDQALSSGKQDMDLSQSTPHHHTEPGPACSACRPWHLRSPLGSASSPVQGVASWAFQFQPEQGHTLLVSLLAEGSGWCYAMPCHVMPCHAVLWLPAGQVRGGGGLA